MSAKLAHAISSIVDKYRNDMIEMQRELTKRVALDPQYGGRGEMEKAAYILSMLKEMSFTDVRLFSVKDERDNSIERPNIVAKLKGRDSSKTIWVMSHMDVVPPGEISKWISNPFEIRIEGDKLFGRGVEDNQQGIVTSIFSVKAIMELGMPPIYDVGLLFVADEETGNKYGIEFLLKNHPQLFRKDDLIIVPDAGLSNSTMIEVAEKSILWIKFIVTGKQAHASTPNLGINPHRAGANLITKLDKELHKRFNIRNKVFDPPISTFEPTKKEQNIPNVNTIPETDIFFFDCRILPEVDIDSVKETIQKVADEIKEEYNVRVDIEFPQEVRAAPATPTDSEVVERLKKAIKRVYNKTAKPMGIGGGTVAAAFRNRGFNAAVWATIEETAHQPNEYCVIPNMIGDTKVFAYLFASD
ncbi:MAG: M20 family metallo-hydrolase [Deltaproteobacteria bacterium]|nr:M20 family metallo-hydrolase [Deltaproteobacteria bacterium]